MAHSALPTWPLILFGVLEPIALLWGYIIALTDPSRYYADQVPTSTLAGSIITPQGLSLTLQLGNILLLLAAVAVICCWTTHVEIARYYILAVAIADLGHIYAAYRGLGDAFWDVSKWNDMAIGNIGASAFLNVNRWLTLLEAFGRLGVNGSTQKKKQ